MFEFLCMQYKLNRLDAVQLAQYVQAECITADEYKKITGKAVR